LCSVEVRDGSEEILPPNENFTYRTTRVAD
jgi:hypothetical protein